LGSSFLTGNERGTFRSPIVILALLLGVSLIGLIGLGVLGLDNGVLTSMARQEYARGLITFLFAVVTIGTALVLVVAALIGSQTDISERQFQHGKEVLSLLLGVFGTIIGYYFGATRTTTSVPSLRVSSLELFPKSAHAGETFTARAVIAGGAPPYHYSIVLGDQEPGRYENESQTGLASQELFIPKLPPGSSVPVHLYVTDADGSTRDAVGSVNVVNESSHENRKK
jgi:hypothetical protein